MVPKSVVFDTWKITQVSVSVARIASFVSTCVQRDFDLSGDSFLNVTRRVAATSSVVSKGDSDIISFPRPHHTKLFVNEVVSLAQLPKLRDHRRRNTD